MRASMEFAAAGKREAKESERARIARETYTNAALQVQLSLT